MLIMFRNNILNISKSSPLHRSSASLLSLIPATASFSTAFQHHRPQGGEGSEGGGLGREEMQEVKQEEMAMTNDAAREGPIRAVEASDMAIDSAHEAMDQGWREAQRAANLVQQHIHNSNDDDDLNNSKGSNNNN